MILIKDFKLLNNNIYLLQNIQILCWIYNIRIHKNIIFLVLRNNHIYLQAVINDEKLIILYSNQLKKESYIMVYGVLQNRDEKNIKSDQYLGYIEILINKIDIISVCNELLINISRSHKDSDLLRNKYRYLDLRNDITYNDIVFKSQLISFIRNLFTLENFIEIQTPIITASSPEGANDYLVLSTKFPKKVYALPQSPQLYKQLLMCGDIHKYFQIAPCFRDESARQNRLPTDFYQLDFEICHTLKIEEIIEFTDNIIKQLIVKYGYCKNIQYHIMTYKEAISIYGDDKIDMRLIQQFNLKYIDDYLEFDYVKEIYLKLKKINCKFKKVNNKILVYFNKETKEEIYTLLRQHVDVDYISYCWIYEYPMYEYDIMGNLVFGHNPFAKPIEIFDDISKIKSYQYDLIINGEEIGSGALRNTDLDMLIQMFENIGYTKTEVLKQFTSLTDAMTKGMPYHGGFAIGIERLCCILKNNYLARNFIAFPFQQNGTDILLNAPVDLNDTKCKQYGFNLIKESES